MYLGSHKTKCESNRTSKKNSPINNTISATTAKNTLNIREARTKPTSPERSFMLINGYKASQPKKQYVNANQREERQALNMISNISKKGEILIQTSCGISQLSQKGIPTKSEMNSINSSNTQKRKNFKNMFYSPKGNREAFTEPHSKVVSQA